MKESIEQFIDRWGVRRDAFKHDLLTKVFRPMFRKINDDYCIRLKQGEDSASASSKALSDVQDELGRILR